MTIRYSTGLASLYPWGVADVVTTDTRGRGRTYTHVAGRNSAVVSKYQQPDNSTMARARPALIPASLERNLWL
jgi:hypothetical protein